MLMKMWSFVPKIFILMSLMGCLFVQGQDEDSIPNQWEPVLNYIPIGESDLLPEWQPVVIYTRPECDEENVIGELNINLDGREYEIRSSETNLGNLVCDSLLWYIQNQLPDFVEQYGPVNIAVYNGGGILNVPGPEIGYIEQGNLYECDINSIFGFDNNIAILRMSGTSVLQMLEYSASFDLGRGAFLQVGGLHYGFDHTNEEYARILGAYIKVNGTTKLPIDPCATYNVITNKFIADGGNGYTMLNVSQSLLIQTISERQVLESYIRSNSPIVPQVEGRIINCLIDGNENNELCNGNFVYEKDFIQDDMQSQIDVLLQFRSELGYPSTFKNWIKNQNPCKCNWTKIECSTNSSTITRLETAYLQGVSGSLSPILSQLTSLEYLDVRSSNVSGTLPVEYSTLTNLYSLTFQDNLLSGTLPYQYSVMQLLQKVNMQVNEFSGMLPIQYSRMLNIESFSVEQNNLSGRIPCEYSVFEKQSGTDESVLYAFSQREGSLCVPDCVKVGDNEPVLCNI
eukprot:TRINITY_DN1739_c0_g1_i1.p1 TRINITY_DN1739_c0_g1~~TRINITY_DN1739_c0_g1_i1.p1  ORF type:complete len:577 (-),score=27.06 TRINITY_DN1739_c0_g1_i1:77-1615(-)